VISAGLAVLYNGRFKLSFLRGSVSHFRLLSLVSGHFLLV
jgi:hypothetical protein